MIRHEPLSLGDARQIAKPPPQAAAHIRPISDPLEREADRAAASIAGNESIGTITKGAGTALNRKEAGGGSVAQGGATAAAHAVSQGGMPLTDEQRAYFEPRFRHDFSDVRLHTDGEARQAALGIGARAYTHGCNIAFAQTRYDTRLLAHELTHVVQQRGGGGGRPSPSGTTHEVEADHAADAIMAGRGISPITHHAAVGIARQPLRSEDESEEAALRRALSSLDWLEAYPPIVFDDNAPVLIAWAERQAEKYFDPDSSDERRAAIAAGLLKVLASLREFESRAKRAPDGALLYTDMLRETAIPWSADRPTKVEDVSPFNLVNIAEWMQAAKPQRQAARGRAGARAKASSKKQRAIPEPSQASTASVNVTFPKQRGMTLTTPEGQRFIIAFLIASTRRGYTGDQINYLVSTLNLEKRWTPPAGMDLDTWQKSFEAIPEGGEVTLTIDKSFTFELDSLLTNVPSDRDFLLEGYREGVLDAEAGLKLGIATFAVGTAALGGGALLGTALAPAGAIGSGGLLGGGLGLSARTVGTHLYLNAPSLYGQAMLYSGSVLSGVALGQHLLDVRERGGVGWHDIPRLAEDLMPFASGYQDYRTFSGGGGGSRSRPSPDEPDETAIGPVRPPVETGESDFVITRPAKFDPASGKVKVSLVELSSKRALDGEMDPQTGNGQIVDRRSREVVGVISNGEIRKPSTALPPAGTTATPPANAAPPAAPASVAIRPATTTSPVNALSPTTPPVTAPSPTAIQTSQSGAPAGPLASARTPAADWRDFLPMARWAQALSAQKHGAPPSMVGMATPGPPISADRQLINQLTGRGQLTPVEMRGYIGAMMREHPVLRQLADAQGLTGSAQRNEMLRVLHRAFVEDGLPHEVVPDQTIRTATDDPGNFASIHTKPGTLQIEQVAYDSPAQLAAEVTHELCAFYVELTGGDGPTLGDYTANEALEITILAGGSFF